ncbi:MAG: peptidylprolyl isomerase [Planctomycetota bacterium]
MSGAQDGSRVKLHYTGTLEDGSQFDSSEGRDPLEFVVGSGQVIAGFDAAVRGMDVGEKKTFNVACADGYGERREDLIGEIPNDQVPEGMKIEVGQQLQMTQQNGQPLVVNVVAVGDASFTIDANHPLAGKDLTFAIEVVEIA